jgi:ribosomal protein S27AE
MSVSRGPLSTATAAPSLRRSRPAGPAQPAPFDEFLGTTEKTCPICVGSGFVARGIGIAKCGRCRGDGVIRVRQWGRRR